MKRYRILLVVVIVNLLSLIAVHAQDGNATPEPGTRADNECYAGGRMEGKCGGDGFHADGSYTSGEVEWAWKCGYYMARFNDGRISRKDVPSECGILLPPPDTIFTECMVFVGNLKDCLTGNVLTQDVGNDGSFENTFYVIISSVVGDGGVCPAGSAYVVEVGDYSDPGYADFYNLMLRHGFKNTDDFCYVL